MKRLEYLTELKYETLAEPIRYQTNRRHSTYKTKQHRMAPHALLYMKLIKYSY